MPLIKFTLKEKLELRIKLLEPKLYEALNSKVTGLYKAQALIDLKLSDDPPTAGFNILTFKNKVWSRTSEEWAKVLAKEIIILLAEDISDIIADEITTYIKSATIIVPPGQAVTAPAPSGLGVTTSPSPPANIV